MSLSAACEQSGVRYLAIDLGDQRTGLALGDDETGVASPIGLIEVPRARREGKDLLEALLRAIERELGPIGSPGELVIGLPLNMDDTEGPRTAIARSVGEQLAAASGRVVHYCDERLSTAAADERMARTGLTHGQKKRRRDAIAAAGILQSFLDRPTE